MLALALTLTLAPGGTARAVERDKPTPAPTDAAQYKIVTASPTGTYIQIGRDLAKWVAEPAGVGLDVLESKGSAENVRRMRFEPGVKLALVQSDVFQAFLDEAKAGNAEAGKIIRPLRLIMPLYDEEIYFVARADSPLNAIHEIKGKKIGVGPIGSGTALSARTLYQLMFGEPLPPENARYLSNEEALAQLTVEKSIDVAIIVAGQPAKLFVDMKPEARKFIKMLKLDEAAPETAKARKTYFPATIRAASYPSWLADDVPTLTVKAYLVTYDYGLQSTVSQLNRFAESLCTNFDKLRANGHPKWKQVKLELPPLGRDWRYYAPMEKRLRSCIARQESGGRPLNAADAVAPPRTGACSEQELVLSLCKR
ncbi:MAG: TAXI family TRAP transporter solute-binding subunit [Gammaproteobacteria bacterium]|nr:TAXI family TRAP transporter solute-binding subunit [Gammaproteobacteria bacterium]MBU1441180.1 TAXI family TRAP transporter solute-binding subunit [Gammaproteobacteria bacterium]MBU2288805.1 TAXI family TRAP transporter solute-binding subunit [Gammaproteobacteria bacterium]MBU2409311.1 TAXI family TRAP transporter solute-binding subunit [Gammaproteobacteria bacterium]